MKSLPNPSALASRRTILQAFGASLAAISAGVYAEEFPNRIIKIVVPYPPGAINDVLARAIADQMTQSLKQSVIVENRAGGNTLIGTQAVATAKPDGYTLLQMPAAHAINASLVSNLPYDSVKSFTPITLAASAPFLLLTRKDSPVQNVKELVRLAKEKPGQYSFGSSGTGGNAHLMGELLQSVAGIKMLHVPYKGTAPVINDLIGGQLNYTFSTYSGAASALKADRVRVLAITSAERSPAFKDYPTIAEAGYPTYDIEGWWAFAAPANTPAAIVERLNKAIIEAVKAPDLAPKLAMEGIRVRGTTPKEFEAFLSKEIETWRKIIKDRGIKLDT
ncbi:Bug family tripartite tricarboxylate transporter substrate binding protein [Ottowia thiooxydans]|uniref:Tripartite-type tricarboxylate transporter receptor subunit TctC n=1 Tax=Ottowia thiooxydans TaxID=219182 RepID=A0ABV2QCL9_9BURK